MNPTDPVSTGDGGRGHGPDRPLPPGQHITAFERFGPPQFAGRHVTVPERPVLAVGGDVARPAQFDLDDLLRRAAPRRTRRGDLHCVSTWSARDLTWEGVPFHEVERLIAETVRPHPRARWLLVTGLDGYRDCRRRAARDDGVLLADRLDGEPLTAAHGAPVRLVAPEEYGYKSVKHVVALEYRRRYAAPSTRLLQHPYGRVAREERSRFLPGPVWRRLWSLALPWMRRCYRRS
ncbi:MULTISPECIES: molybdopterin-dependent oxidoreductase [Streptomyces]|uniref:molybdopterin-dependent oxidoreductase n=1 Tax=Streptomyces TaxID=1883 RepID=UPI00163CEAC3|nr:MULTISPECIES: molybdopterin-dependent oxidoreductase [Streptomyces]MBC2876548.1 molybdopterin-dependent oxidoreductase [Streptomyces sp. TYQ1024]UBI40781.1 molybdopterin-dependent oxidoreductase [Streptomyces mobaraensis]